MYSPKEGTFIIVKGALKFTRSYNENTQIYDAINPSKRSAVSIYLFVSDQTEELRYKYVIVELFGAGCLPLFTTILQVCSHIFYFVTTFLHCAACGYPDCFEVFYSFQFFSSFSYRYFLLF